MLACNDVGLWRLPISCQGVYMSTDVVSVRVPSELKSRLDALSASTGRPQGFYVREALADRIDAMEWAYGVARLAEDARSGREPVRPLDELAVELGFDPEELRAMGRAELADDSRA